MNLIEAAAHEEANIIFGTVIDDALGDEVRVTVIAAGFDTVPAQRPPRSAMAHGIGQIREARADLRPEPRPEPRPKSRPEPRPEPRPELRSVQTTHQRFAGSARPSVPIDEDTRANPLPAAVDDEDDDLDVPDFMK